MGELLTSYEIQYLKERAEEWAVITPGQILRLVETLNEALSHLRYIHTNREWGKSIRYPELDEFLAALTETGENRG